jgi:hypothetical protein
VIDRKVTVRAIGREQAPVIVVDHFCGDPDALREFAATQEFVAAGRHYPGIRARLPDTYMAEQGPVIAALCREVFGIRGALGLLEAQFSVVTLPPDRLLIEQRLPHVDAVAAGRLALVHYLVPGGTGGTAFYRHRGTGFETIDEARSARYLTALNTELAVAPPVSGYPAPDMDLFDCIATFDGSYNRALIYRGGMLHSGAIGPDALLSADPGDGRLTVTGFFAT